ncbi:MAG: hypothetical protein M0Z37_04215 [Nitrospiraceae bacterium]|jgi:hypothetical protein|nr:hypothetical protein [Nitrospiraceae bacterium]
MIPETFRRCFPTVFLILILFPLILFPHPAYAVMGSSTMIESRILWVESQTRASLSRLRNFVFEKDQGQDFLNTPVLPPSPPVTPVSVTKPSVSEISRSAREGMGAALGGIASAPAQEAIGQGVHQMAYSSSPEGALRLGADTQGHIFQMLLSIHQDLLYLLKEQSSTTGLEGSVLDHSHNANLKDQQMIRQDLPRWIMMR